MEYIHQSLECLDLLWIVTEDLQHQHDHKMLHDVVEWPLKETKSKEVNFNIKRESLIEKYLARIC